MTHFVTEKHKAFIRRHGIILARCLIAFFFIVSGVSRLADFQGSQAYIASTGAPMPELLNIIAIVIEVGGALALFSGFMIAEAAAVLIAFTLITTIVFYGPGAWFGARTALSALMQILFLQNLAVMGGLLYVMGFTREKRS